MRSIAILSTILVTMTAAASHGQQEKSPQTDRRGNALTWVTKSVEYQISARQAYQLARLKLDSQLANTDSSADEVQIQAGDFAELPPAIILDVDETVLDNSEYNVRNMKTGLEYGSDSWVAWGNERVATAVPGVVEFLKYAQEQGVTVFLVTNRKDVLRQATFDNLKIVGLNIPIERILTRNSDDGRGGDKISRRAMVAQTHRILLLIGDNFADLTATGRNEFKATPAVSYGWVLLPNPVYGYWEERPSNVSTPVAPKPVRRNDTNSTRAVPIR